MGLDNLSPAKGSVKNRKRIGRGNATGQGRTAGKGHKGYKSRSGASNRFHFEGGQTPMARRIPKRGLGTGKFNHMQTKDLVQTVNLDRLEKISVEKIDVNILVEEGIIKKANNPVKILGNGEITKAIEVSADMFSKTAVEKIQKAGGKVIYL
ncbi:MAG: 50S ribosomal protein L15 [Candidatus Marinimicrobia bacterium]|nr:50S ribosomal protein L15 [Candidatus Neomarinimicrobiota bacterium]|tara:strand:+ start:190 stop:645 length:456 start_codon:yes stop_codon:yes gene_type:complete